MVDITPRSHNLRLCLPAESLLCTQPYPLENRHCFILSKTGPLIMHVCIIGSGVIGATSAWFLAQAGHKVTLLDSRHAPGLETSFANAGQLSYSYVAPLAEPSVIPNLPKWLLDRNSPLRFRPQLSPSQWCWSLAFLQACRAPIAARTTAEMLTLSYLSRDAMAALLAESPLEFHHQQTGKLIAYRTPALLEKARKLVNLQATHGSQQQVLSAAECLTMEPAMASFGSRLAGAVFTPSEAVGDCHLFTQALVAELQNQGKIELHMNTTAAALERQQGRITAVRLADGARIQADHFVLANALGARDLLRPLGENVPLYPLKGYSLSIPIDEDRDDIPHVSVTDYERRIVYARIGNTLRIAAMVDMGDVLVDPNPKRVSQLKAQVGELFPQLDLDKALVWAGLRPTTPDSKPRIGRSRSADNLWLNLGHGALGFTLACGSGVLLQHLMDGQETPIAAGPFAP